MTAELTGFVLVVGAGPVGHSLAAGLSRAGVKLHHWSRSRGALWEVDEPPKVPDVVVLAVRDDVIAQAAHFIVERGAAGKGTVLLHCAGAHPPEEVFAEVRSRVGGVGLLHPLRALSGLSEAETLDVDLRGTVMALCGDEAGLAMARSLVQALSGVPLLLLPEQLGAYHAAAALCSGHVAAVLDLAAGVLQHIGLDRRQAEQALAALCVSAAANVGQLGLPMALTGPIARGDVDTVRRHLRELPGASPEADRAYRALGPAVLDLARRKGVAAPESLAAIASLLLPAQVS